jgi:hypothetical protein
MCLKHFAPFKCEFVPVDVVQSYFTRYPEACKILFWDNWKQYMVRTDGLWDRNKRDRISKEYDQSHLVRWFVELVQSELNFEKSTVATGHIMSRWRRVYHKTYKLDWHRRGDYTGPLYFTRNREEEK